MTDRPILFSAPMVRALLDGRKTQTRRILKPQPQTFKNSTGETCDVHPFKVDGQERSLIAMGFNGCGVITEQKLPIEIADRLYVRETWAVGSNYNGVKPRDINPGGKPGWCGIRYAATDHRLGIKDRPSIHMPRWASRITLTVTDVRVERLQDINGDDAEAEGLLCGESDGGDILWSGLDSEYPIPPENCCESPEEAFADLWDSVNGDGAWGQNPWVVAYTFTVAERNIDQEGE